MIELTTRKGSRAFLNGMIKSREEHLKPIARAAHNGEIGFAMVGPGGGGIAIGMHRQPFVAIFCDDSGEAVGPGAFDAEFVVWFAKQARHAFIHAWQLDRLFYGAALVTATTTGESVLFIETRLNREQEWLSHIGGANSGMKFTIASPAGGLA